MRELEEIRRRVRNIWGAISSNQVIDKDVEGQAKRLLDYIDELRRAPSPSPAPVVVTEEILATVKQWHDWAFEWSGTAFIADEALPLDAMTDAEHKTELYSGLCKLGNTMAWLHEQLSALASLSQPAKGAEGGGL